MAVAAKFSVAVIGAGWLGEPLARALAADGHPVRVSTTTPARLAALAAGGLVAHRLTLEPESAPAEWHRFLEKTEMVVVSLPPGLRGAPDPASAYARYAARLARLGELVVGTSVRRVLLLSSTAVYPDLPDAPEVTEAAADSAHPLVAAEASLAAALPEAVTLVVARLGGLMGPGRAPGRFFGPGRPVPDPIAPVNMLHLTDAIGAVRALLAAPAARAAYGVCAAGHPSRASFYAAAALALGLPVPPFSPATGICKGKQVSSARLRTETGYCFRYDDPVAALAAC